MSVPGGCSGSWVQRKAKGRGGERRGAAEPAWAMGQGSIGKLMRAHGRCRFLSQLFLAMNKKVKARKNDIYLYICAYGCIYVHVFYF